MCDVGRGHQGERGERERDFAAGTETLSDALSTARMTNIQVTFYTEAYLQVP